MYVEFYLSTGLLSDSMHKVSGELVVEMKEFNITADGQLKLFCVVQSEAIDEFELATENDPSVEKLMHLSGSNGRRLYQLHMKPNVDDTIVYRKLTEFDGFIVNAQATNSGWYLKTNFPDRDAFRHYRTELRDYGIETEPTVVRDSGYHLSEEPFGISSKQIEVIVEAVKTGYFEVPRGTCLAELAGNLEISDQAASERLRRAQETLAENAVSQISQVGD